MEQNNTVHLLPGNMVNLSAAVIEHVNWPLHNVHAVSLDVLRLDKIDPVISGNKWFKLKYYLEDAVQKKNKCVLTFGGAWSNHIVATACAAKKAGLKSIGIIRGEKPANFSRTLLTALQFGMQLEFVSRENYQQKDALPEAQWLQQHDYPYIIPEGGAGPPGVKGASEICGLIKPNNYTHLLCAVGTGTLLSGLATGAPPHQQITGIAVLKGFEHFAPEYLNRQEKQRCSMVHDYHFGGYAKKNSALLNFMNLFYQSTGIPTDFVYTGKLFFAITDLIENNHFPAGSRLLAIHSGGLQGNSSLPPKTLVF